MDVERAMVLLFRQNDYLRVHLTRLLSGTYRFK